MKHDIIVHIVSNQITFFNQLLAQGIIVSTTEGTSVYHYLADGLGIAPEYINHRIQTIFLNGKAVDNVHNTFLKRNATLALSAAMPGLVGATFRKSGFYSSLRKNISLEQQSAASHAQTITFTLKLFNSIAMDLGPGFFQKGIQINGGAFQDFIVYQKERFMAVSKKQTIQEKDLVAESFISYEWKNKTVHLIITEEDSKLKQL